MIFSKSNPPPGFYVYIYLREDNTPYYVGKGSGKRAWIEHRYKNKGVRTPTNLSRIIVTHHSLSELWSYAIERWFIRWYGRKDNNTGILRNRTDGGEGGSGSIKPTQSIRMSGKNNPMYGTSRSGSENPFYGRKHSEQTIKKTSGDNHYTKKDNYMCKMVGKNHPMFGRSWYNNGIISIVATECPNGFVKGRLSSKKT